MVTGESADMPSQERKDGSVDGVMEDITQPLEKLVVENNKMDGYLADFSVENGAYDGMGSQDETNDQLTQLIIELSFQNDYLKSQIRDMNSQLERSVRESKTNSMTAEDGGDTKQVNQLHEKIKSLNKEIQEQRQTQKAAEDALEHLRQAYSEADSKAQELSVQLIEAQKKLEQEIMERDDKYVELDSKFGRLHKRAKQRIQELQKDKDDLEARLRDVNVMVEQASTQQTLAQQELECTRQQASEALRSMDAERQQLRTSNNKLRDNIDEMHRSLEAKENTLEGLHQSLFEKEQLLEQTRALLHASEEKKQALASELSSKHQKQVESLEAQLADALSEGTKAAESIASLQVILAEKDSKIAELDAASTGETARLEAALEEVKGELTNLKDQHEKERQSWEASCQSLRMKLEASESACLRADIEVAKLKSQLDLEMSTQNQLLNTKDAELAAAKDEINRLESEFSAYKVRAHALLQKKDAELSAAQNSELIKAQEEAIKESEKEAMLAFAERDKAIQDLQVALANHNKEIGARDAALGDAEKRITSMTMKLDSAAAQLLLEKEAWQKNLESIEENWRLKYGALEAQKNECVGDDLRKDLDKLKQQYERLKEEHDTFRDIADRSHDEKEKEIAKLIEENKNLRRSLELRPLAERNDSQNSVSMKQDSQILSIAAAEQQILLLARQQAQREEELAQSQRHILALQEEIEELEHENHLHSQQEAMLKAEFRNMERSQKREGVDMTYLKNVILKLLETGEVEALLPVVGTLLQFSPEEIRKCQQAYRSSSSDASSPAASFADTASTPRSLFSRFSFS